MTLINCPACKKEISNKAASCPHCGHPINESETSIKINPAPQSRRKYREGKIIFFLILFGGILLGFIAAITGIAGLAIPSFVFIILGLIGAIINSIGSYLNQP